MDPSEWRDPKTRQNIGSNKKIRINQFPRLFGYHSRGISRFSRFRWISNICWSLCVTVHAKIPPKAARGIRWFSRFPYISNICSTFCVMIHAKIPPKAARGISLFSRYRCTGDIFLSFFVTVHANIPPKAARGSADFRGFVRPVIFVCHSA